MNRLPLFHVFSALTLLAACSDPSPSHPATSVPEITEPTTTTVEVTVTLHAAPDGAFGEVAAASAGDGGAIAFAESEGWTGEFYTQTRLKLQRLDNTGAMLGPPTELGVIPSNNGVDNISRLTLASDGVKYLACWGFNTKISCAAAPVGQGEALPALSISGRWPSLAYGSGGWALGYGIAESLAVLHLDDSGMGVGDAVLFDGSADAGSAVFLAATPAGFALLGESGSTMHLHSINNTFSQLADPIDLGQSYWFHGALAASGTKVAVSLGEPYAGRLILLDNETITESIAFIAQAGKTGLNATLGVDESSFGMLSADTDFGLHYGSVDEQGMSPPSTGALDEEKGAYTYGSLALVKLHDETFLAAAQAPWIRGGKLVVAWARRM